MKYILTFSLLFILIIPKQIEAQSFDSETSYITVLVPSHFIMMGSKVGEDRYRSKKNHALLSLSKEYKGLEDSFLSATSASSFARKMLSSEERNLDVSVVDEKIGKLQYSIVSWLERGERNRVTNHMRAYNDTGVFIHCFEMSSHKSNMNQLDKAFHSFLKSCRPTK